jgi:acetolactate synthase-1/2/3 large subunit
VKLSGGQIVVRALEDEGVPFTFGIPGTHNIELYDALAASTTVRPVLVTDEQSASFMADAVWRSSGRLACANVVPGAGLTHAMSGIGEAFLDNVALLVLGCGIRRDTGKAFQLHDVDQVAMVRPVTKAQFRPQAGEELYATIREACRIARAAPAGPVFVEVPANLYLFTHDCTLEAPQHPTPDALHPAEIQRAADLLNGAKRPLLYLGLGAAPAAAALVALAERLEAPVATTFQGKGVFPESHPLALWPGFGDAAPPFAREVADACDATLAIGCRFGEVATGSYGMAVPRPLVHVDVDPGVFNRNYAADATITGDSGAVVNALLEKLAPHPPDHALRARIRSGHLAVAGDRSAALRARIRSEPGAADREFSPENGAVRVSPYRLLPALQETFGREAIFTADSGNGTFLALETLRLDQPGKLLAPVDYSCMGYAVPAAIGAKLARPECPVIALAGDGAFLMTGLELLTAAQLGVAVAVFVLNDGELAQIAQFQEVALNRKTASVLANLDFEALARAVGVEFLRLGRDADIAGVLERAAALTAAGTPVLVDVAVDYSEKTYFTRGVVKTTLLRLPWRDRLRFVGRALFRKVIG